MDEADTLVVADELARERVLIDALPYLDNEYEDPAVQAEVSARGPHLAASDRSSLVVGPRSLHSCMGRRPRLPSAPPLCLAGARAD